MTTPKLGNYHLYTNKDINVNFSIKNCYYLLVNHHNEEPTFQTNIYILICFNDT